MNVGAAVWGGGQCGERMTTMEREDKKSGESRRGFLRLAGLGSVAAGAALVTGGEEAEAATAAAETSGGYRETPHVLQAYAAARF